MNKKFAHFTQKITAWAGTPVAVICAFLLIIIWVILGPVMGWSETHQLLINTTTTIITFLMVFMLQNTQNRDSKALHTKIDELLELHDDDSERFIDLEEATEEEIQEAKEYVRSRKSNRDSN